MNSNYTLSRPFIVICCYSSFSELVGMTNPSTML